MTHSFDTIYGDAFCCYSVTGRISVDVVVRWCSDGILRYPLL